VILSQDRGLRKLTQREKARGWPFHIIEQQEFCFLACSRKLTEKISLGSLSLFNIPMYRTFYFERSTCQTSEQESRSFHLSEGPEIYNVSFTRALQFRRTEDRTRRKGMLQAEWEVAWCGVKLKVAMASMQEVVAS
jgi:hypothetical protein